MLVGPTCILTTVAWAAQACGKALHASLQTCLPLEHSCTVACAGEYGNAELLHKYGFVLRDNPFDVVTLDRQHVLDTAGGSPVGSNPTAPPDCTPSMAAKPSAPATACQALPWAQRQPCACHSYRLPLACSICMLTRALCQCSWGDAQVGFQSTVQVSVDPQVGLAVHACLTGVAVAPWRATSQHPVAMVPSIPVSEQQTHLPRTASSSLLPCGGP